ncbi:nucleotidyltransferase family protein [Candidatus Poriferisodalis sp.]|uniref:nucleotidyltransferase family protein n=1 Tax=Candidatus Poriferisodalis sp. TaxID=3101277 RepID=UPI003B019A1B
MDRFIEAQPVAPSITAVLQPSLKHFLEPCASAESADLLNRVLRSRRRVVEIAHAKGASNVRVVGSVARGEARNDSDIDVLITAVPGASLFDSR